jgi:AcrR family transcriptional regulator
MAADEKNMEDSILRAAEELFLEQGFAKTTTGQIAKLVGCNQALVHYYYRTKERLFERVFEKKIRYIADNILAIDEGEGTFTDKIARMIGAHFDFLILNPLFVPFIAGELLSNPARFAPLLDKHGHYPQGIFAKLDTELQTEVAQGTIRPMTTLDFIATVMSLNVTPFLVLPALRKLTSLSKGSVEAWLAARRQENIETVLSRLRV